MAVDTVTRTKGERTRAAILDEAARLATILGLDGLSIGGLAKATGMSKSGLYAHFGSKLELQLATIEAARETFIAEVLRPSPERSEGNRAAARRLRGVPRARRAPGLSRRLLLLRGRGRSRHPARTGS